MWYQKQYSFLPKQSYGSLWRIQLRKVQWTSTHSSNKTFPSSWHKSAPPFQHCGHRNDWEDSRSTLWGWPTLAGTTQHSRCRQGRSSPGAGGGEQKLPERPRAAGEGRRWARRPREGQDATSLGKVSNPKSKRAVLRAVCGPADNEHPELGSSPSFRKREKKKIDRSMTLWSTHVLLVCSLKINSSTWLPSPFSGAAVRRALDYAKLKITFP